MDENNDRRIQRGGAQTIKELIFEFFSQLAPRFLILATVLIFKPAICKEVSLVAHVNSSYAGYGEVQFPPGTTLKIPGFQSLRITIETFNGRWDKGLANGYGELQGAYTIPSSDNLTYTQLQSADPVIRSQANQLIERIRSDAAFVGKNPQEAVDEFLGAKTIKVAFKGDFKDGAAFGDGELSTDARKLKGSFYNWLPEGLMTHYWADSPVIVETYVNGVPGDGLILINQYPAGLPDASRRFVGTRKTGKVSGDWYQLLWKIESSEYSTVGMGNTTQVNFKDGSSSQCQYRPLEKIPLAMEIERIRGKLTSDSLELSDMQYLRPLDACTFTADNNWVFRFTIEDKGPFDRKVVPPYSCFDSEGRTGTLTFSLGDIAGCHVEYTTYTYKWLSKIGKETERIGRQIRDVILWPIDTVGKAVTDTICDVAQKTPGKDCNVSMSYGVTYEIVDKDSSQKQRATEDLARFLKARERLFGSAGPSEVKGQWEEAAKSLDKCYQTCVGPYRAFAMLSLEEINAMMITGFEQDVKKYRLASMTGDDGRIFDVFRPAYPFMRPQLDVEQFKAAMANVWDFSMAKTHSQFGSVDPRLTKYIGGVGAVMEAVQMAVDFHTMRVLQQKIMWEASKLQGGEVGHFYIMVSPSGDVTVNRMKSLDDNSFQSAGVKWTRTTIVGVMSSSEILSLRKEEQEKSKRALELELDKRMQEQIKNSLRR